jgi:DNA-binding MarR family transcriptional regulator
MRLHSAASASRQFLEDAGSLLRALQLRDRASCSDHGLTAAQWHVLRSLFDEGPITMRELAERIRVTRSTLTRIVDLVEKKGFIKRRGARQDRRQVQVLLTRKGEDATLAVRGALLQSSREILQLLRPHEQVSALSGLALLAKAAGRWADRTLPSDALRSLEPEDEPSSWMNA